MSTVETPITCGTDTNNTPTRLPPTSPSPAVEGSALSVGICKVTADPYRIGTGELCLGSPWSETRQIADGKDILRGSVDRGDDDDEVRHK